VYAAVDAIIEKLFGTPGPCNSRLALVLAKDGRKEIFTCNFDGSEMQRLTHNRTISTEPSWSRDGRYLVYTVYGRRGTQVAQIDVDAGRQRSIASFPGLNAGAALSPDGTFAALCLSRDGQVDLYVMRVADGKLRRLTRDLAVESSPTWSPRGRRICYVSDRAGGRPQLYLVDSAGGRPSRLATGIDEQVSPDWCPRSNRICFAVRRGREYAVALVDMGAEQPATEVLTSAAGDFEAPTWGPDGRHLMCTREVRGGRKLCLVDSWSGRILPVAEAGPLSLPSWGGME
jgi:TolB protein